MTPEEVRAVVSQVLGDDMGLTKARIDAMDELAKENHRALYGHNRTPGVISDVDAIKEDIKEMKADQAWERRLLITTLIAVVVNVILQIGG